MKRRLFASLGLALLVAVSGCGPGAVRWEPEQYTVQRGDTLYSIAWEFGLDYQDLARWNDIGDGYVIHPGQRLRLTPPEKGNPADGGASAGEQRVVGRDGDAAAPGSAGERAAGEPANADDSVERIKYEGPDDPRTWQWPVEGRVIAPFGEGTSAGKGVDIAGRVGRDILAAASGRVVYSGSGLIGFGKLIIVKHDDRFLSAYAHNDKLLVAEGDRVQAGDRIAAMGRGPDSKPMLHFEIRLNGKPVDPMQYLPER